jgi:hypothetical protein
VSRLRLATAVQDTPGFTDIYWKLMAEIPAATATGNPRSPAASVDRDKPIQMSSGSG